MSAIVPVTKTRDDNDRQAKVQSPFSAIADQIIASEERPSEPSGIAPETREAMIRMAGEDPAKYSSPRKMASLPPITNPDFVNDGYSQFQMRSYYDRLSPDEQHQFDYVATNGDTEYLKRRDAERAEGFYNKARQDLSFPVDNLEQIAADLGVVSQTHGAKYVQPHIAKLLSNPEGKKFLEEKWTGAMLKKLGAERDEIAALWKTQQIDGSSAVALADFRRGVQDTYGGTLRAGWNLGGDLLNAGARQINQGFWWSVEGMSRLAQFQNSLFVDATNAIDRTVGDGTKQFQYDKSTGIAAFTKAYARENAELGSEFYYRPAAKGSAAYRVMSNVSAGLGSVGASIATYLANPALGFGVLWGSSKGEIHDSLVAEGMSDDDAHVISDIGGTINAMLEYAGIEGIMRAWKAFSPVGKMLRDSVLAPAISEGATEFSQGMVNSAGVEIGRSRQPGYEFDLGRFLAGSVPQALESGAYGAIVGGLVGFGGSHPARTVVKEINYRNAHKLIDSASAKLAQSEIFKKNPAKGKSVVESILDRAGAPKVMYQAAEEVRALFQEQPAALEKYLAAVDVTPQDFNHALNAGSDVEISVAGLVRYQTEADANPDVKKLARPEPDAPNLGVIAEREKAKSETLAEYNRIRQANETLPEPFAIFRQQLLDAGRGVDAANHETDVLLAGARVAGKRLGITAEQFLNIKPIQTVLANGLEKVRSAGEIVGVFVERRAAQEAKTKFQGAIERMSEQEIEERTNTLSGMDKGEMVQQATAAMENALSGHQDALGALYLDNFGLISFLWGTPGNARKRFKGGSGLAHIFEKRKAEAMERGFTPEEAERQAMGVLLKLPDVIANGTQSPDKFNAERMHVVKDGITAILTKFAAGGKSGWVLTGWDENLHKKSPSDEPGGVSPGPAYTPGPPSIGMQTGAEGVVSTIPVAPADVNLFDNEVLSTLMQQAGVKPEQAEAFSQYAKTLLDQGGDLQDAEALAGEVETALEYAEGFEQAAAGLERILAKPEEITQNLLDAMDIDAGSIQEGVAAIRVKKDELSGKAEQWRNFYQSPKMVEQVRTERQQDQAMAHGRRLRGSIFFRPNAAVIRLFNSRQDRSTVVHELFHYFYHDLETAAKKGEVDSAALRDYLILNEAAAGGLTATDEKVRAAAEEKVAAMWEKYLMEGVAPAPRLTGAFARFRTWLTNIYRDVAAMGGVDLTDDVRGVFNRLIAAEEEMAAAREFYDDKRVFAIPEAASENQRGEFAAKAERARLTAEERQVRELQRANIAAKGGRRAFRARAEAEVRQQRPYRVIQALKNMGGLARADVDAELGSDLAEQLFKNHRGVIKENVKAAAEPADMAAIATEFGYDSQLDMIAAVAEAPAHALPTDANLDDAQRQALKAADRARETGGLDELYVIDRLGAPAAERMREVFGGKIFNREGGKIGAVLEAERFGYESLRDMLMDVAEAVPFKSAVTARTDQMIAIEYAETRRLALEDAATPADEAYHNDAMSDFLSMKQRFLDAKAGEQALRDGVRASRMLSNKALREMAAENSAAKSGRKAGQYHIEAEAFKRHSKNAFDAEKKGDYVAAAREHRYMMLAHHGIQEAIKARHELDVFEKRNGELRVLQRLDGERGRPRVQFHFREAIKDILATFKVTKSLSLRPEGQTGAEIAIPGHGLTQEVEAMLPAMAEAIPPWIVKREGAAGLKSWKDLTLGQIRELDLALKALENVGRGELEALRYGKTQTIEQLANDSIARMLSRKGGERPKTYASRDSWAGATWDKFRDSLERLGIKNYIPEYVLAMADGNTNITGKGIGPLQSAMQSLRRGLTRKSDLAKKTMAKIAPAMQTLEGFRKRFKQIDPNRLGQFPESLAAAYNRRAWDGETAIMMALNSGNAGNLKALLDGYGIKQEQWQAIASTMTEAEWRAVQTIWDALDEYYPLIDAVTYRMVNRHVKKVEAQPFTVVAAEGTEMTLNGGYFPLVFDRLVDSDMGRVQDIEVNLNKAHFNAIHTFAKIADNFTRSRLMDEETGEAVVKRPPLLELDVLTSHVDKVAHYVALADAVSEFDRLTLHEDWAKTFIDKFGQHWYEEIRKYLKNVADPDAGNLDNNEIGKRILRQLRRKATTAALGLRFWIGIKQRFDYAPAALHMSLHSRTGASGFKYLWKGMRDLGWQGNLGLMNAKIEEILKKSEYMRDRDGNITREMREMVAKTAGKTRTFSILGFDFTWSDVNNAFFAWIQMNDRAAACAAWLGAYKMALDGNGSFDPAGMTAEQLATAAINDADAAAATFASSTRADLTAWQRDQGIMNLFSTFLSSTVRRTSRLRQYVDALQQGQITKRQFLNMFVLDSALQAWVPGFLYLGMKALTGDDDDEPSMWDWMSTLFLEPVATFTDGMPFVNMLNSGAKYGWRGAFTPAGLAGIEKALMKAGRIPGNIEKDEYGKALVNAMFVGTYAAGIPAEGVSRDVTRALQTTGIVERKNP